MLYIRLMESYFIHSMIYYYHLFWISSCLRFGHFLAKSISPSLLSCRRYSRPILYYSCFSLGISQFFKDPRFLLVENSILTSRSRGLIAIGVSVLPGLLSDTAKEVFEYICMYIHILSSVFLYLYIYIESRECTWISPDLIQYQSSFCVITFTCSVNLPSSTISLINSLIQLIPACICNELPVATRPPPPHQVDIFLLGPWYPVLGWCHPYSLPHVGVMQRFVLKDIHWW